MFVLFNRCIDKLTDDIAEQRSISLTKFFDVELISVERLDLFVVFLSHHLAKLMQEDVLGLSYVVILETDELGNSHSFIALLWQVEQRTPVLEVDFP